MARIAFTEIIVSAVGTDFYVVHSWLRDTCIPEVRPLYNAFNDYHDRKLKAAALLKHTLDDNTTRYELVIEHAAFIGTFQVTGSRSTPTLEEFQDRILERARGGR